MYCGNCGKKMDDEKLVCSSCGWQVKETICQKSTKNNLLQRINMDKWALIGAVVCGILAVVFEGLRVIEALYNKSKIMPSYYVGLVVQVLVLSVTLVTILMGERVKCKIHVIVIYLCQVVWVIMNYVSGNLNWFQHLAVQLGLKEEGTVHYSFGDYYFVSFAIETLFMVGILLMPAVTRSKRSWKGILFLLTILLDVACILNYRSWWEWIGGPGLYYGFVLWIKMSLGSLAWLATCKVAIYFWMWWLARKEKREGNI